MNIETLQTVMQTLAHVPGVAYTAEDWGQLDLYDNQPPVRFPCALVSIDTVDYSNTSDGQIADAILTVRYAESPVRNGSHHAPGDRPFAVYDRLQAVCDALNRLSGETFSPLVRQRIARIQREDSIREYAITYRFCWKEE